MATKKKTKAKKKDTTKYSIQQNGPFGDVFFVVGMNELMSELENIQIDEGNLNGVTVYKIAKEMEIISKGIEVK